MYSLNKRFAPLCFSLVLVAPAQAAFNPTIVAADAKWVVFVDMNGLRGSTVGREAIATMQRNMPQPLPPSMGVQFDFERMLGTIGNVTAYGSSFNAKASAVDGALIVEGTGDLRKISEGWLAGATLAEKSAVTELSDLPFPGYAVNKEVIVGFPSEPIVLIGKSKEQIIKAYAVFRGEGQSLAQSASSPLAKLLATSGRAYAVAASVIPPSDGVPSNAPQARILQLVGSGMISLSEISQQTIARAELVAKSDDIAEKLLKIVQGLTAMVSLTETNDRQLAEFMKAAIVTKQDRTVSVRVAYSSDRIVQMIENAQDRNTRPQAQPRGRRFAIDPKSFGTVVEEWKLDLVPAGTATMAVHSIPNVPLSTGAVLALTVQREDGAVTTRTAIDRVDIFPMSSGAGLRFEAESMRLRNFGILNDPTASGGRVANAVLPAVAQFEFPGAEGEYIIHVHYLEESVGKTTLAVSVRNPAPPSAAK